MALGAPNTPLNLSSAGWISGRIEKLAFGARK